MATKKRTSVKIASVYFEDQINDVDEIGGKKGISRSQLLREGADAVISANKEFLTRNKKA